MKKKLLGNLLAVAVLASWVSVGSAATVKANISEANCLPIGEKNGKPVLSFSGESFVARTVKGLNEGAFALFYNRELENVGTPSAEDAVALKKRLADLLTKVNALSEAAPTDAAKTALGVLAELESIRTGYSHATCLLVVDRFIEIENALNTKLSQFAAGRPAGLAAGAWLPTAGWGEITGDRSKYIAAGSNLYAFGRANAALFLAMAGSNGGANNFWWVAPSCAFGRDDFAVIRGGVVCGVSAAPIGAATAGLPYFGNPTVLLPTDIGPDGANDVQAPAGNTYAIGGLHATNLLVKGAEPTDPTLFLTNGGGGSAGAGTSGATLNRYLCPMIFLLAKNSIEKAVRGAGTPATPTYVNAFKNLSKDFDATDTSSISVTYTRKSGATVIPKLETRKINLSDDGTISVDALAVVLRLQEQGKSGSFTGKVTVQAGGKKFVVDVDGSLDKSDGADDITDGTIPTGSPIASDTAKEFSKTGGDLSIGLPNGKTVLVNFPKGAAIGKKIDFALDDASAADGSSVAVVSGSTMDVAKTVTVPAYSVKEYTAVWFDSQDTLDTWLAAKKSTAVSAADDPEDEAKVAEALGTKQNGDDMTVTLPSGVEAGGVVAVVSKKFLEKNPLPASDEADAETAAAGKDADTTAGDVVAPDDDLFDATDGLVDEAPVGEVLPGGGVEGAGAGAGNVGPATAETEAPIAAPTEATEVVVDTKKSLPAGGAVANVSAGVLGIALLGLASFGISRKRNK
ncbi:MAG: hypothetical protein LBJ83_02435 [Oscillospiraceae bacterium]|nr:hypothetical protein [Oscillospiraceae bacterium]